FPLTGPFRVLVVLLLVVLSWLVGSALFGGESGSPLINFFTGKRAETRPRKYKCGLSAPCPPKHLAFRLVSGAANVIGPKICLEDKILPVKTKSKGFLFFFASGVTGELMESKSFDMWAGDITVLLKFLRVLHEGTLVLVASWDDAATKMDDEARRLFEELGSSVAKKLAFRDTWVFVGAKGIENKTPFEQLMKNNKNTNKYEGWPESLEMDGCIPLRPPGARPLEQEGV
uniref:FAM3 metabolism regulating signaling molecule A n=1 Tax=Cynoglossus semilaevis TaxID=244447 RepID=A0A3P8UPC6_CYNSE